MIIITFAVYRTGVGWVPLPRRLVIQMVHICAGLSLQSLHYPIHVHGQLRELQLSGVTADDQRFA